MKTENIRVRVTKELKEQLKDHCEKNDKNISKVITRLIEEYLKQQF